MPVNFNAGPDRLNLRIVAKDAMTHLGLTRGTRRILRRLRLERAAVSLYRSVLPLPLRLRFRERDFVRTYGDVPAHAVRLDDVTTWYSTRDAYSRQWFGQYAPGEIHEEPTTRVLLIEFGRASVFADVGANLGWFTCLAAGRMPEGRVHAFEMDDLNATLLQRNVELNGFRHVEVVNGAVSDAPGYVSYDRPEGQMGSNLTLATSGAVRVQCITLDGYFAERGEVPDLLKVDVEGAEMKVLRGADGILSTRPRVVIELHPANLRALGSSSEEVLSHLVDRGYRVQEIVEHRTHGQGVRLRPARIDEPLGEAENRTYYATPR